MEPPFTRRTAVLVGLPALVGVAAGALVWLQTPTSDIFVETRLWLALMVAGFVVAAGVAAVVLMQQRTNQARQEGALEAGREAERDHSRFLLRLDHELKNPVTAIRAGLANLAQEVGDDQQDDQQMASPALASISTQVDRLAALVADLRKLAELESRTIERAPVDLAELLEEVRDAVTELPAADERTVALALPQAPWPLGTVPGDRDLLFLALHNLVANAVKFTQAGDVIEVRAREDGDQIVVEVADTGAGIPANEVDQVWDELARGSAARGTPGMGLGLALVRGVMVRHEGQVWLRSRPGDGTVVGLALPTA